MPDQRSRLLTVSFHCLEQNQGTCGKIAPAARRIGLAIAERFPQRVVVAELY